MWAEINHLQSEITHSNTNVFFRNDIRQQYLTGDTLDLYLFA